MKKVTFTSPYLDETIAFIVEDHRRDDFNTVGALKKQVGLRIGVEDNEYYIEVIDSPREFFRREKDDLDALLLSAETGSSWCLIYPEFTVAVPHPRVRTVPMSFAVRLGDRETAEFLSTWIGLKKRDNTINDLFDYWVGGKKVRPGGKRWCIIRNVLGWVD